MTVYGYARVSTDGQDTAAQVAALKRAGATRIVQETRSGAARRPALEALLQGLRAGDVLLVWKVDRLARSLRGVLDVHDLVQAAGAGLRSVTEPIDTTTPVGRAFFQLLGVFAELERSLIRERCEVGRREARARGVRFGPPVRFDAAEALRRRERGETWRSIAREWGCAPSTVRRGAARAKAGQ